MRALGKYYPLFFLTSSRHAWSGEIIGDQQTPLSLPFGTVSTTAGASVGPHHIVDKNAYKDVPWPHMDDGDLAVDPEVSSAPVPGPQFFEDAQFILRPEFQVPAIGFDMSSGDGTSMCYYHSRLQGSLSPLYYEHFEGHVDQHNQAQVSPDPKTQPVRDAGNGFFTCPHGCSHTFKRASEYRRHMKKHSGQWYTCTQSGCTKSFYRTDKLRDHLRQRHRLLQN